ncbi:MAG: hypothetical protein RLZZ305_1250 [Actinomycetota bacterium]
MMRVASSSRRRGVRGSVSGEDVGVFEDTGLLRSATLLHRCVRCALGEGVRKTQVGVRDRERNEHPGLHEPAHTNRAAAQVLTRLVLDVAEEPFDTRTSRHRRIPLRGSEQVALRKRRISRVERRELLAAHRAGCGTGRGQQRRERTGFRGGNERTRELPSRCRALEHLRAVGFASTVRDERVLLAHRNLLLVRSNVGARGTRRRWHQEERMPSRRETAGQRRSRA